LSEIQEPNKYSKREGYCRYNAAKPINDVRNTLGHRPSPPTWYLQKWIGRTFLNLSKELKEVENCRAQAKGMADLLMVLAIKTPDFEINKGTGNN
jgi:hypothetical protein